MGDKINTVCFTGHRNIPREYAFMLPKALKHEIEKLINRGACTFRAGGAIGFDTVAALCVLELKEKHPNWTFEMFDTGLDWNVVLFNQTNPAYRSLIPSYFQQDYVGE